MPKKSNRNLELAGIFYEIADILEIKKRSEERRVGKSV